MKPQFIVGAAALLLIFWVSWMFRYDSFTYLEGGGGKVPIMLDRWTGNTYIYHGEWEKIETVAEPKWETISPAKK